jgi:alkylation response protein AidB-like acyl-CoA dehydrogenase
MDFTFNEDQQAIRELAHQIFTDRATDEFLLAFDRTDEVYDEPLLNTLAEQGLLGITIPEQYGGTGLGMTELCLILEEQGRRVAPIPLYSNLVRGVLPLNEFGSEQQKQQYLPLIASGKARLTAAIAEMGMSQSVAGSVSLTRSGDNFTLNGQLDCVPDGPTATAILVPASDSDGNKTVFIVDAGSAGLSTTAQQTSLGNNQASLAFDNVSLAADAVLGKAGEGQAVLDWLEMRAELGLCAQQIGVTEEALKRVAEFTCERKQFGAAIGSFQAVAMQAADAYIDVEAIRSSYWLALYKLEAGEDCRAEVRVAKWFASNSGHRVAYRTQHLYGGMGVDVEFPSHRYFLWAKHIGMMLGGRSLQISKLGALLASDDNVGTAALKV